MNRKRWMFAGLGFGLLLIRCGSARAQGGSQSGLTPIAGGLEVRGAAGVLRVVALREDVLRVDGIECGTIAGGRLMGGVAGGASGSGYGAGGSWGRARIRYGVVAGSCGSANPDAHGG